MGYAVELYFNSQTEKSVRDLRHILVEQGVSSILNRLQEELEDRSLRESANLYAEMYDNDSELQELTEAAISGWPETLPT